METRTRRRERADRTNPGGSVGGGALDSIRAQARNAAEAADRMIDDILSGDSEAFLRSVPQQSGQ